MPAPWMATASMNDLNDMIRVAEQVSDYILIPNVNSDVTLDRYVAVAGQIQGDPRFPEAAWPYLNFAKIGAEYLLSQMLSLPENWDYTLKGLSLINREQIDAIRAAIRELEQAGYIVRSRERDSQGRLRGADYVIYEQPQPVPDSPTLENPMLDNPTQEKPS